MDTEIKMPDLATTDSTVTIVKWLIEVGGPVQRGQPLLEIETDKAQMQVESVASGTLKSVAVNEGDEVAVGATIAVVADETLFFESDRLATLVDDQFGALFETVRPRLKGVRRLGCDDVARPWLLPDLEVVDLGPTMYSMRRKKDPDEVQMLRHEKQQLESVLSAKSIEVRKNLQIEAQR